jgi:hypothetical protein
VFGSRPRVGDYDRFFLTQDREFTASVELIEGGAELAGAVGGGAIGLLGGPPGAIGGAAVGVLVARALKRAGYEVHERVLAPRQRIRAGAALHFALDEVRARLVGGEEPRTDGFFEGGERSSGEELLEGVLLQAADAYEERKLRYLGRLYASFVFSTIPPAYAHYLLRVSERLTYRQFVLIGLIGQGTDLGMTFEDPTPGVAVVDSGVSIGAEFVNLGAHGLVAIEASTGSLDLPDAIWDARTVEAFRLNRVRLTSPGRDLYEGLGLVAIPAEEIQMAISALGYDTVG